MSSDPISMNQGKMFIGGLSSMTSENSMRQYFGAFGDVIDPVIMRDKESNTSRGFGFITFRDPTVLDFVLSVTPHIVDGKQIDCKRAVPKDAQAQAQQQFLYQQNLKKNQKKTVKKQKIQYQQNQFKTTLQQQQQLIEEQKKQIMMLSQQHQQFQNQQKFQPQNQNFQDNQNDTTSNYSNQKQNNGQFFTSSIEENEANLNNKHNSNDSQRSSSPKISFMDPQMLPEVKTSSLNASILDPQYRKVFVGGLPHNLEDEEFKAYFAKFGEIDDSAILKDKRTGKPRGFGFVTYIDVNSVDKVMDMKESHVIQGKWVDCKRAVPANQMKEALIILEKKNFSSMSLVDIPQEVKLPASNPTQSMQTPGGPISSSQSYPSQQYNNFPQSNYNPFANKVGAQQFQDINKQISTFQNGYQQQSSQMMPPQMTSQGYQQQYWQPQYQQYQQQQQQQNMMGQQMQNPQQQQMNNQPQQQQQQQQQPQQQQPQSQQQQQQQNPIQKQNSNDQQKSNNNSSNNYQDNSKQFTQTSQPFYKGNQQQMNSSPMQQMPNQQYMGMMTTPGYQMMPQQYPGMNQQNGMLGPNPQFMYQNQQAYFNYGQQQQMFNKGNFQSGFPYSQTFQQQIQQQYQNQIPLGPQDNGGVSQFTEQMNDKQQEQTEWHIQSLDAQYSRMNMDETEQHTSTNKQPEQKSEQTVVKHAQTKQQTINSLNEEIKVIEEQKDEKEQFNWQDELSNKSQISGFYTNFQDKSKGQQPDQDNQDRQSISRPFSFHERVSSQGSFCSSPSKKDMGEDTLQPQESETSMHSHSQDVERQAQPVLKRVESEGSMGINSQEVQNLRGRHILGSGKDFEYGKDRPSSKAASDKGGKTKPEYGQIRSEMTQGPSKRADRQYKPF